MLAQHLSALNLHRISVSRLANVLLYSVAALDTRTPWDKHKASYELALTAWDGYLTSIKDLVVCPVASGEATFRDNTLPKVRAKHFL